jgi:hypothetical protein
MERFKKLYHVPSANVKKKSKDKESLWKKFRDRFTVPIIMGERIGYDTMWQLANLSSGDHSPSKGYFGAKLITMPHQTVLI